MGERKPSAGTINQTIQRVRELQKSGDSPDELAQLKSQVSEWYDEGMFMDFHVCEACGKFLFNGDIGMPGWEMSFCEEHAPTYGELIASWENVSEEDAAFDWGSLDRFQSALAEWRTHDPDQKAVVVIGADQ